MPYGMTDKMSRDANRKAEWERLSNRLIFTERFLKLPSQGVSLAGLGQWVKDATDLNNIGAGFNQHFECVSTSANANTVAFYSGAGGGIRITSGTTAQNDDNILRPITQATAWMPRGTKATVFDLADGYDFWLTWSFSRQTQAGADSSILQGFGWGSSAAAGASGVISAASTTNDSDQALFIWQPSVHPNLRFYTCSDGTGTYYDLNVVPALATPITVSMRYNSGNSTFDVYVGDRKITTTAAVRSTDDSADGVIPVPYAFIEDTSTSHEGTNVAVHGVQYEIDYTT